MHQDLVVAASVERGEVALCDADARYHVARASPQVPPVGAYLGGDRPLLGRRDLQCLRSGRIFEMDFRGIDFGRLPRLGHPGHRVGP